MNDKKLLYREISGLVFVLIAGTLLHFVYEWTGESAAAAIFSAVSESTWEHLKLLFFPMLVFTAAEQLICGGKDHPGSVTARAVGTLAGMAAIVVLFYVYTGIVGENFLVADILTFVAGTVTAFVVSGMLIRRGAYKRDLPGLLIFTSVAALFALFTFSHPDIGLFRDPTAQ